MARSCLTLAALLGLLLTSGCWGPYYRPAELELPPIATERPIKRVVVDGFLDAFSLQWTTVSKRRIDRNWVEEVTTYYTSNRVRNVSAELALALGREGLPAVAVTKDAPVPLEPGDVVVKGLIDTHEGWGPCFVKPGDYVQVVLSFATLGMYGLFLPYFYPVAIGTTFEVSVDVRDHTGKQVLLSKEQPFDVYNESLHLIGWSIDETEEQLVAFRSIVARGLAKALGQRVAGPR